MFTEMEKVYDNSKMYKELPFSLSNLQDYLERNLKSSSTNKEFMVYQFIHGQSNPTFYIKLNGVEVVLRKKPHGKLLKGAHLIEREYKIICSLSKVNFPVAEPLLYCSDNKVIGSEFYVMKYVRGRILRDSRLNMYSPEERHEIYTEFISVMAKLHSLDVESYGLIDLNKSEGNFFERQIYVWSRQYKQSETENIKSMNSLLEWLPKNVPKSKDTCLVHGDLRLDNVIFHPTENKILAVLDWELATIGSPIADVAYACAFYHMPPEMKGIGSFDRGLYGIPHEAEFKLTYFGKNKSLNTPSSFDWNFYVAFSIFKFAAISQGVYKRSLEGNASSPYANTFKEKVKLLADIGYSFMYRAVNDNNRVDLIKNSDPVFKFLSSKLSLKFYQTYIKLLDFMETEIYPNERLIMHHIYNGVDRWSHIPQIYQTLTHKAKSQGLWNLFLHEVSGLTNLEYALLCEKMGRSFFIAPEVFNCSAPDTGNMEVLYRYGNEYQKKNFLQPLLDGEIRSCFAMTEKGIGSSDATNIQSTVERDGDEYIVNGRKWYISGAGDPRCKVIIFMGITRNKSKPSHQQHSMIIIPMDTPGVKLIRPMKVFGYDDAPHGHMDMVFENVRVPKENLILGEGRGFEIAQGRLGPGRIHHCMRILGIAERAIENAIDRVAHRKVFGKLLKNNDAVIKVIAKSKSELIQARLSVLFAADRIDQAGNKDARDEIGIIKILTPSVGLKIIDRAIQLHGAEGVSQDTFLSYAWALVRTLRIADGPDEVHLRTLGNSIIRSRF